MRSSTPPPPPNPRNESTSPLASQRRMGRGMLTVGWVGLLAMLTWLFAGIEKSVVNPNGTPELLRDASGNPEIVLKQNRYGHYVADGTINGRAVTFLLDTGASTVSIPERIADDIGLTRGPAFTASTAAGTVRMYATRLDELTLGNMRLTNVPASINPHVDGDLEILLGMTALRDVELTQRDRTLIIRQK